MRPIIADILELPQYLELIKNDRSQLRPKTCPYCPHHFVHFHGCFPRKPDRTNSQLNPIPIFRFRCPECRRTCSVLPECISSRRWYMWLDQEVAIKDVAKDESFRKSARQSLPSRQSIARWWYRLVEQFEEHHQHFRVCYAELGKIITCKDFWVTLLKKISLSKAMLSLIQAKMAIP